MSDYDYISDLMKQWGLADYIDVFIMFNWHRSGTTYYNVIQTQAMPTVNHANRKYYPDSTKKNGEICDIFTENNEKIEGKSEDDVRENNDDEVFFNDNSFKTINKPDESIHEVIKIKEDVTEIHERKDVNTLQKQDDVNETSSFRQSNDQINSKTQDAFEKSSKLDEIYNQKKIKNLGIADKTIRAKTKKLDVKRIVKVNKKREETNKKNKKKKEDTKWRLNSSMLATLVFLNVTGHGKAVDVSTNSLAYLLGYPVTCSLGDIGGKSGECTLSLACWLSGGIRHGGCGGWLFSCCGHQGIEDSIPSNWGYEVSPPRLRNVPQRNVMPNNVFRRRVDEDVPQIECGLPSSRFLQKRIIGGREARLAEFPWQAHVRISEFQCGGVVVSQSYVATAAHCVSRAHIRDIVVWLGALDTSVGSHTARKVGVHKKILHPLFQFRMTQPDRYDIALLRLTRPVVFSRHILAICLPESPLILRGRTAVIAGWGKTDATDTHTGTNMLRSATVPILSKEQCIAWHQSKQISVEIHSEMICAGHSDGHQDACLGDSGGPLIVLENGRYYLVGITSAGFGCGVDHQPGIYHNVQMTSRWIRSVIYEDRNVINEDRYVNDNQDRRDRFRDNMYI